MNYHLTGWDPAKKQTYEIPISAAEHQRLEKQWLAKFDPVTCELRSIQRLRALQESRSGKSASASSPSTTKPGATS